MFLVMTRLQVLGPLMRLFTMKKYAGPLVFERVLLQGLRHRHPDQ
jgi:hypothetical protein